MVNNGNNKNCGFEDAMVLYIYDEIGAVERSKFETHLVDCSVCVEEFAEISGARYSIFEWQKEAFAELPTPEIVIPYTKNRKPEAAEVGFFAGLRGLFGGFGVPLSAAAAVLFCLGVGFAGLTMFTADEQMIANVTVEQPKIPQGVAAEKPVVTEAPTSMKQNETLAKEVVKEASPAPREIKPVKVVVESRRSLPAKQLTAETADRITTRPEPISKKAPALSNFDEASDRSLRLTDLFDDEVGSIR